MGVHGSNASLQLNFTKKNLSEMHGFTCPRHLPDPCITSTEAWFSLVAPCALVHFYMQALLVGFHHDHHPPKEQVLQQICSLSSHLYHGPLTGPLF